MKSNKSVDYAQIKYLIQQIAGTYGKANVKLFDAIIQKGSINKDERTCIVDSVDGSLDNLVVRYMLDVSDGDTSIPLEETTVTIAMTDFTDPYIVKSTWLSEKLFVVGEQSYDILKDKQVFNDGKYGGIPIVKDPDNSNAGLLKKINQLEEKYNDLLTSCKSVTITLAPTGTFPTASFYTTNTPISPTTKEVDISNPNITHGDKF